MAKFNIGDKVLVNIEGDKEYFNVGPVARFDKKECVISKISAPSVGGGYMELEGAVSDLGVPYAFHNAWLKKIK